jgi:hypothetical protein
VFENRVLRIIFGPKREAENGGWRKLYNEELHNLYSSPSIIRMMKSRRMKWAGHVARKGRREIHIGFWRCRKKEIHQNVRRCIILKWILDMMEWWIDLVQDRDQWMALVNAVMNLLVP